MGMDVYGNDPKIEKGMDEFPIYAKYEDMNWGDREKDPKWEKEKDDYYSQWKEFENSNPGVYFRNNCWWWRPLWDYCLFVDTHYKLNLIDEELYQSGHHNDGAGLNDKDSVNLAMHLQMSIEDGTAEIYANERQQYMDSLEDEPCSRCNNNNRGNLKKKDCNPCGGKGTRRPFATHYPFNLDNVAEFAKFLEYSGGFSIN